MYEVLILAGGLGSRLAPITDTIPKPLAPIANVPVLERLTAHLKRCGFEKALLATCALPEQFRAYRDPNLTLDVRESSTPKGSAGCVKELAPELAETVLILSGDVVTDIDLRAVFDRHVENRRKATMLLTHTDSPGEFGVVSLKKDGAIGSFFEKPSWRDTCSDLVSTGIYVLDRKTLLDHIPDGVCWEFGRDFFPALLADGIEVYGETPAGRWWDVGTPESFYRCSMALADGEENVVGEDCEIDEEASVRRSVLFDRVKIGRSRVEGSILCRGVRIGNGCRVPAGCLIGEGTVLEDGVALSPGVKLKGGLIVHENTFATETGVFGTLSRGLFGDERIEGDKETLDAEFLFRLGRSLGSPGASLRLGILHGASARAKFCAELLALGARDTGAEVLLLGEGFPAVASFASRGYDLDLCVCADVHEALGKVDLRFCDRLGLPLSRDKQRGIEKRMRGGEMSVCVSPADPIVPEGEDMLLNRYCRYLQEQVCGLSGVRFSVSRRDEPGEFLYSNARTLGADAEYGTGGDSFTVSPDGRRAGAVSAGNKELTYWHLVAIACESSPEKTIGLPAYAPDVVVRYLEKMGKVVLLYNDVSDSDARRAALRVPFVNDGVLLCLVVASILKERASGLDAALSALPPFALRRKLLPVAPAGMEDNRARVVASLSAGNGFPARVFWRSGCVSVFPNASGGFTLLAEAPDPDSADALCRMAENFI